MRTQASNRVALSAHLIVEQLEQWTAVMASARHVLQHLGIERATLQPEGFAQQVRWFPRASAAERHDTEGGI